ncbi:MAG: zinc ribbon domain-containing protein [Acidobacteriota bacterium]|nr:zinc ribbon domain-containing protein [Acidobacteriota bacterium]
MSSPEISRRCRGCGASVRMEARFCPQCGATMVNKAGSALRRRLEENPANYDATLPPPSGIARDVKFDNASDSRPAATAKREGPTPLNDHDSNESSLAESVERRRAMAITAPPKRRHPVTVVEENLRPRVEKLREASIVMLDEAPDDSGLRFVLIGVALFLVFLLFLYITIFTY